MLGHEQLILEDGIDLFLVGIHFDESRALELIPLIRKDTRHSETPIIVIRLLPTENQKLLKQSVNAMQSLHIVSDYLELEDDRKAKLKIRQAVDNYVPKEKLVAAKNRAR